MTGPTNKAGPINKGKNTTNHDILIIPSSFKKNIPKNKNPSIPIILCRHSLL